MLKRNNKMKLMAAFAILFICISGFGAPVSFPADLPEEIIKYRPETLLEGIELIEKEGGYALFKNSYKAFFNNFNFINPTAQIIAASSAGSATVILFDYFGDKKPELLKERYKLSKARWGYGQFIQLFPAHEKVSEAVANIERLSKRIDEIDAETATEEVQIPEANRPEPKSMKWIIAGDNWLKDLGAAAPAFAISGSPSFVGLGIYQAFTMAQRAYRVIATDGYVTSEDLRIETEYLASFARMMPKDSRPPYLMKLARAYEQFNSIRSLSKALDIYKGLQAEGIDEPNLKKYLGSTELFKDDISEKFDSFTDRFKKRPTEVDRLPMVLPFDSHIKRVRESMAAAIKSYAEEFGDITAMKQAAEEYADTVAGKDALSFLQKGKKLKPKKKWTRQASIGGRINAIGFDVYGSGYNLFGDEESISIGISNAFTPFGDIEVPYVHRWLGGFTPAFRAGEGWFSFVLNPAKEKKHLDKEFFLR